MPQATKTTTRNFGSGEMLNDGTAATSGERASEVPEWREGLLGVL